MSFSKKHIDKKEVILHLFFWIGWIVSFTVVQSIGEDWNEYFVWLMYYLITLPIFVIHTYLVAYWLIPLTFFRGRYVLTFLGFLILLVLFSIMELIVSNELVFKFFDVEKVFEPGYLNLKNILISGVGNHYIILVFLAIKAGRTWYTSKSEKEVLIRSKLETDLEIYRYQLQPKLILALIEELELLMEKNAEKVSEMIVKISAFINRFIYEGKEELIPLSIEIQLIKDFLEIHKHALGSRLKSNLVVNGKLKSYVVPPLLLLPFINSAMKMVYECNITFESTVIIKAEKNYLLFSFSFWSDETFRINDNNDIEIIRKRLKYNYPGKHRLIENTDENYREFSLEVFS